MHLHFNRTCAHWCIIISSIEQLALSKWCVKPTVSSIVSLPSSRLPRPLLSQEYPTIACTSHPLLLLIIQPTPSSYLALSAKRRGHAPLFPSPSKPQSVHTKITSCLYYIYHRGILIQLFVWYHHQWFLCVWFFSTCVVGASLSSDICDVSKPPLGMFRVV